MLTLAILSLGACLVYAQPSRDNCCTPMQWEGHVEAVVGGAGQIGTEAVIEAMRVHVDHQGKRTAASVDQFFEKHQHRRQYTVIDNFETKKRIVVEGETCTVSSMETTMKPNCLPPHHAHFGMYKIGAGEASLEVDAWGIPTEIPYSEKHIRTIRLGAEACVPYQFRSVYLPSGESMHPAYISFNSFNRITAGIEDDSVFNTPEQCRAVEQLDIPLTMTEVMGYFHEE